MTGPGNRGGEGERPGIGAPRPRASDALPDDFYERSPQEQALLIGAAIFGSDGIDDREVGKTVAKHPAGRHRETAEAIGHPTVNRDKYRDKLEERPSPHGA
jgi:hypothetical protein